MYTSKRIDLYVAVAIILITFMMIFGAFGYAHEREKKMHRYTEQEALEYLCESSPKIKCSVSRDGKIYVLKGRD